MRKQHTYRGRQSGKTGLTDEHYDRAAKQWADFIDSMILNDITGSGTSKYRLFKTWRNRRGQQMHRVGVSPVVLAWLEEKHPQFGKSNPEWWKFEGKINITDRLYLIMVLKFGGEE